MSNDLKLSPEMEARLRELIDVLGDHTVPGQLQREMRALAQTLFNSPAEYYHFGRLLMEKEGEKHSGVHREYARRAWEAMERLMRQRWAEQGATNTLSPSPATPSVSSPPPVVPPPAPAPAPPAPAPAPASVPPAPPPAPTPAPAPPPVAPPPPPIVVRTPVPITGTPHQEPPDPERTRQKLKRWHGIHGPHSLWGHMMRYVVQDDGQSQPAAPVPRLLNNPEEKPQPEAKKEAPKDDKKDVKKEGEEKKKAA